MPQKKKTKSELSIKRVIVTSFIVDISDVVINIIVAIYSGSITMAAQALEGGADLLSSGLLLIGVKLSEKPPSKKFPYGHGREIYFWTFLSGMATFTVTATLSFWWGLKRFLHPETIGYLGLSYVSLLFSLVTNGYAFSLSYRRLVGKKNISRIYKTFIHSALIETKTTFVLDLMGTAASFFGLFALIIYGVTGDLRFDGIGAMITGISLAFFAFFILKGAKELLVGQSAPPETVETIKKAVESFNEVQKVLDLRTLLIGSGNLLVNIEVNLIDSLTTNDIEKLTDRIEKKISSSVKFKTHVQIELETPDI